MALIIKPLLCLSLLIILVMIPNSSPNFLGSDCPNTTVFKANSVYQTHLETVFHSLSTNATNSTGFFATSSGNATSEVVYGLFLCRGDQDTKSCHDCVTTATSELPEKCPNRKVAVIWYDECMVRYSSQSLMGKMDLSPSFSLFNTQNMTGNLTKFTDVLGEMMNYVSNEAANGGSLKKFATDKQSLNTLQTLYALGQCTPDLSASDCKQCLSFAIGQLQICRGARVLQPSCSIDYEMYPFFNGATNLSSPPLLPPPTNSTGRTPVIRPPTGHQKSKISAKVIIAIVLPVAAISLIVLAIGVWLIRKNAKEDKAAAVAAGDDDFSTVESLQYDFETLQSATNNFSDENKLGEGGFGGVYKGTLPNGQEIAVKRLSKWSGQGIQEFKNEVSLSAKLQHRNLVKVLGFCFNQEERLLAYEYVPNKSLDYFLFDPEKQVLLDWGMRCKIIKGIARGVLYLHEDSRFKVVHRDLKASNILLDMDMNPKISDFGMARIFGVEESEGATSRIVGTYGYMAPEYAMHGQFSSKSDIYSFGVLLLEIISGKRNNTFYQTGHAEDLLCFAWMKWIESNPSEFMDPVLRHSCSNAEVMRYIQLGLLCVQESVDKRPTMATVLLTLESYSVTLSVPEKPVFFGNSRADSNIDTKTILDPSSKNSAPLDLRTRSQSLNFILGTERERIGAANHSSRGSLSYTTV